jgi:hypothetical protein
MSTEIDNPETLLEKVDALTNLVEQMLLAHKMRDEKKFNEAHDKAAQIGFEVLEALQESEPEEHAHRRRNDNADGHYTDYPA